VNNAKQTASAKAQQFFDELWSKGDFWAIESSAYEQERLNVLIGTVADRRYRRALEIGCGGGAFTRLLSDVADEVVGVDISEAAIERARNVVGENVKLRVADAVSHDWRAEGEFDLIVMTETIYYLGWLYPFFDLGWLASELHLITAPGGRLLLANTEGGCDDMLVLPHLIRTYHDLFRHAGFEVERETIWSGEKDGAALNVRVTLYKK
jgi:predicted TPR repeat methyltransferase